MLLLVGFFTSCLAQQDTTLKEYAGNFVFPDSSVVSYVNITFHEGTLSYTSDQGNGLLVKQKGDTFSIPSHSGTGYFKRDDNKKINGIVIDVMGYHLTGTKENNTTGCLLPRRWLRQSNKQAVATC
jgi:hypothetical protein